MWKISFLNRCFLQNQFLTNFEEVIAKNRVSSFSTFWNNCPYIRSTKYDFGSKNNLKVVVWLSSCPSPGLHNSFHPTIRDGSTWRTWRCFPILLLTGALWFSENFIRYSLHVCLREVKNNFFSFKHSYLRHFSWRF